MKPLSMYIHLKSNIKRILPAIITIALEFAALTFMISIGYGVAYAADYNLSGYFDRALYIEKFDKQDNKKDMIDTISNLDNVNYVTEGELVNSIGMLPLMYTGTPFYKIGTNNIQEFISKNDLVITSGRTPAKENEILLTEETANLLNVKVGGYIGPNYDEVLDLDDDYKVVGIIKGQYSCYLSGYSEERDKCDLLIQCKQGKVNDVLKEVKEIYPNLKVKDCSHLKFFSDSIREILIRLGTLALGIFSIVILITVINLTKSLIGNFSEEYSVLKAIGYTNKFIKRRICGQIFFILMISSIIGIGIGFIINLVFKNLYCIPRGIPYMEYNIYMFAAIFIAIILFLMNTINITKKVKTMEFMGNLEL